MEVVPVVISHLLVSWLILCSFWWLVFVCV